MIVPVCVDSYLQLPMGSVAQQMAMRNWFFHFQSADHAFLVQSNIFNNVSAVLANVEEPEVVKKKESSREGKVSREGVCQHGEGWEEGGGRGGVDEGVSVLLPRPPVSPRTAKSFCAVTS